jgi:hypothetical protein
VVFGASGYYDHAPLFEASSAIGYRLSAIILAWWPCHPSPAQNMNMQMRDGFAAISSVIDYNPETAFA